MCPLATPLEVNGSWAILNQQLAAFSTVDFASSTTKSMSIYSWPLCPRERKWSPGFTFHCTESGVWQPCGGVYSGNTCSVVIYGHIIDSPCESLQPTQTATRGAVKYMVLTCNRLWDKIQIFDAAATGPKMVTLKPLWTFHALVWCNLNI